MHLSALRGKKEQVSQTNLPVSLPSWTEIKTYAVQIILANARMNVGLSWTFNFHKVVRQHK